ncbi:glutathione hydrolase 7 [Manduca sexta]|uniref:Uncharacterized protein n=1 Tax=Manduca sexta TaxID=7130 RepID=A0A921ZI61_MANSE|nr:glutathione hydrolase 7 [Manduca sexta]KAG6457916.1 hypothetical protein O3G_MSEX010560 [Manduca sexta]KAG6457917.1 hypothetical protein O3G_MSEX010560 [Manduca sexta]
MQSASGAGAPAGAVELREDVPLKSSGGGGGGTWCGGGAWCAAGPRLIAGCFAALSAAITLALLTQIYSGDYEVVPHGSVSSSAAECSRAGTDALKAGGRAVDAAVAAALCLAVVAPHRTSLDASGALVYWEYRRWRSQPAEIVEWGGAGGAGGGEEARPPRLVAALAVLHARRGVLPWARLLQPAADLARLGFPVSEGLATALATEAAAGGGTGAAPAPGSTSAAPALAAYLHSLQANTSAQLSLAWGAEAMVSVSTGSPTPAGAWRVVTPRAGAARVLAAALAPPAVTDPDLLTRRVVVELQKEAMAAEGGAWPPPGVATGLAVVDPLDTYLALVTGVSVPFGSGPATAAGWTRDEPRAPLDLAPALLTDDHACGTRYVIGAESSSALAQGGAALAVGGGVGSVERARVSLVARGGGALALEALRALPPPAALPATPAANATPPYAALNVVQQRGDALLSHADSRGGGLASRF